MTTLVVGWNSNIDELGWGVSVTEGNNWDINIGSLLDSLSVGTGISDDNEAGFLEGAGDVVGEVTGGEATSNGDGTGVSRELQDSTLTVGTSGDDTNVGGVVNSRDDTGCEDDLLPVAILLVFSCPIALETRVPGLSNVDNIHAISSGFPQIGFHVNLEVLCPKVDICS